MSRIEKIGSWLLGGIVAIAFLAKQRLSFGVKAVYLNGLITLQKIPLRIDIWIANKTIGSVLVRSLSGALICNGQTVATISQMVNKRISANSYIEQSVLIDLHNQESLQALFANIQSGSIDNLAFELIGEVVVGEQWPVAVEFNRVFTWADIRQMI